MTFSVTDDEAFIRTIVASPGDDAPRLVYADWLEERGDERGAYLRHEVEWAKTSRQEQTAHERRDDLPHELLESKLIGADAVTSLQKLASGLDPVWTARVSRPPVGVCYSAKEAGDHAEVPLIDEIRDFERQRGITLPAEYCAFHLNGYGGRYWAVGFPRPRFPASDCHLQHWFPIKGSGPSENSAQLDKQLDKLQAHGRKRFSALVAMCAAHEGNDESVAIGVGRRNAGKIYFVDERNRASNGPSMVKIAESLGRFLAMLYPIKPDDSYPDE